MKRIFLSILLFSSIFLVSLEVAAQPQAGRGMFMQVNQGETRSTGIEIVPALEKPENARKIEEKDFAGYVMVYFKDQTHCGYLAISRDGYTFTDINGGQPVFDGTILAGQKGVRDPYICRGPDGAFYVAMTDLHVSGQRAGYRQTQWERPECNTAGGTTVHW